MVNHQHRYPTRKSITPESCTPQDLQYQATSYSTKRELDANMMDSGQENCFEIYDGVKHTTNSDQELPIQNLEERSHMPMQVVAPTPIRGVFHTTGREQIKASRSFGSGECANGDGGKATTPNTNIQHALYGASELSLNKHTIGTKVNRPVSEENLLCGPGEKRIKANLRSCGQELSFKKDDRINQGSPVTRGLALDTPLLEKAGVHSTDASHHCDFIDTPECDLANFSAVRQQINESPRDDMVEDIKGQNSTQEINVIDSTIILPEQIKRIDEVVIQDRIEVQACMQKFEAYQTPKGTLQHAEHTPLDVLAQNNEQKIKYQTTNVANAPVNPGQTAKTPTKAAVNQRGMQETLSLATQDIRSRTKHPRQLGSIPRVILDPENEYRTTPHMVEVPASFPHSADSSSPCHIKTRDNIKHESLKPYSPSHRRFVLQHGFIVDTSSDDEATSNRKPAIDITKLDVNDGTSKACFVEISDPQDIGFGTFNDEESDRIELIHKLVNDGSSIALSAKLPPIPRAASSDKPPPKKKPARPLARALAKTKRTMRLESDGTDSERGLRTKSRQVQPISNLQQLRGDAQTASYLNSRALTTVKMQSPDGFKKVPKEVAWHPRFQQGKVYIQVARTESAKYCYRFEKPFLWHVSSWFAASIESDVDEPDHDLAEFIIQHGPYDTRYELVYSDTDRFWVPERSALTKPKFEDEPKTKGHPLSPLNNLQNKENIPDSLANRATSLSIILPVKKAYGSSSSLKALAKGGHSSFINGSQKIVQNHSPNISVQTEATEAKESFNMIDNDDILGNFDNEKNKGLERGEMVWPSTEVEDLTDCEKNRPPERITTLVDSMKQKAENEPVTPLSLDSLVTTCPTEFSEVKEVGERVPKDPVAVLESTQEKEPRPITKCGIPIIVCEAYNNLFLILHGMLPKFNSVDIEVALDEAEMLAKAALTVGCLKLVSPHIYSLLHDFGDKMYISIFKDPPRWLKMSCALRSGPICRAAVTHIVGQYPYWPWKSSGSDELSEELRTLIRQKFDDLSDVKSAADNSLFISTLADGEHGVSLFSLDKSSFNSWFVIACWRDWYCYSLAQAKTARHNNKPDASMYRLMAQGGGAYLPLASVVEKLRELKGDTLTPKDLEEAAHDLRTMKEYAAEQVKPLCVNRSMLDVNEHGIGYFTCVDIADCELPWLLDDSMDEI